jgi:hypothetical protein
LDREHNDDSRKDAIPRGIRESREGPELPEYHRTYPEVTEMKNPKPVVSPSANKVEFEVVNNLMTLRIVVSAVPTNNKE